jgi:predicted CoA-binding protein
MNRQAAIESFLSQKTLALVGASRSGKKFGNTLLRELRTKGYAVLPVHPDAREMDGMACVPSLADLPSTVGGLVLAVPPARTEALVEEAARAGIRRIWMQQGSASPKAIRRCEEHGIEVVHGECLLMFADPVGLHRFHRWLRDVFGKLPPGK